jgi:hypothetical protein
MAGVTLALLPPGVCDSLFLVERESDCAQAALLQRAALSRLSHHLRFSRAAGDLFRGTLIQFSDSDVNPSAQQ